MLICKKQKYILELKLKIKYIFEIEHRLETKRKNANSFNKQRIGRFALFGCHK